MANKITKRMRFEELRTLAENANKMELVEFIDKEIERLENKSANRKPTKAQMENAPLIETIKKILLETDVPLSIKDIKTKDKSLAELSPQKISSLLTLIKKETGLNFVRTEIKKVAYFKLNA